MKEFDRFISIAKEIAEVLRDIKEIKAIAVGGGVVYGHPDKYSDLDIHCIVRELPDILSRKKALANLGLEQIRTQKDNQDTFFYKGIAVGVEYMARSYIDKKLGEIRRRGNLSRDDALIAGRLIHHRVLWDPDELFYNYKKEFIKYARKLRSVAKFLWAQVEAFLEEGDWPGGGGIHAAIKRKNYIWVTQLMGILTNWYLLCLYTLNDVYYHDFMAKWAFKQINGFKHKPKDCVERLEKMAVLGNKGEALNLKIKFFDQLVKDTAPLMKRL